jgi:hypothetical protein
MDRNTKSYIEERVAKITEVSMIDQVITVEDQFNSRIRISMSFHDPLLVVPQVGEVWTIERKGIEWFLKRRSETGNEVHPVAALSPGDVRVNGENVYLDGVLYFNGTAFVQFTLPTGTSNDILFNNGSAWAAGKLTNSMVSSSAAINISKLANYPTDATKFLRGDGTWVNPSPISTRFSPIPISSYDANSGVISAVANTAYGYGFYLPYRTSITNFYHSVIITGGNYDFGIYDSSFNAIWRYGSHAVPAASTSIAIAVAISAGTPNTSPLILSPGFYYLVSAANGTTAQAGMRRMSLTPTAWDYFTGTVNVLMIEGV